ncbi:hypothetical protein B0H11DRAFT_1919842 [Mycena galericulata]|nr:hypothetical protein B0H11DRAFT_1919842 [Mycena galericulata]
MSPTCPPSHTTLWSLEVDTAGNVVANRLTEIQTFQSWYWRQASPSFLHRNEGVLDSMIPFFVDLLGPNIYDWNYTTTPQVGLNGRVLDYLRVRTMACSTPAARQRINRYAELTGDPGWYWDEMLSILLQGKNEKWSPPADHHDTQGQFDPSVHSTNGINSHNVLQTTQELPGEFPLNPDGNNGKPLGLVSKLVNPSNSTVYGYSIEGNHSFCRIGGDPEHSHAFGDWRLEHFESVGHSNCSAPSERRHERLCPALLLCELDLDASIFGNHTDPSAGPETPHNEVAFAPMGGGEPGHFVGAGLAVVTPMSRKQSAFEDSELDFNPYFLEGSITINSSDPLAPPVIDLGMLTNDFDIFALREALRRAQRFYNAPNLQNITTEALDEIIRNTVIPTLHMVGSSGMSARDAQYGVVDPDLHTGKICGWPPYRRRLYSGEFYSILFASRLMLTVDLMQANNSKWSHTGTGLRCRREGSGLDQATLAAVAKSKPQIVSILLAAPHFIYPNECCVLKNGETPHHVAVREMQKSSSSFSRAGTDQCTRCNSDECQAIHLAVLTNDVKTMELLAHLAASVFIDALCFGSAFDNAGMEHAASHMFTRARQDAAAARRSRRDH